MAAFGNIPEEPAAPPVNYAPPLSMAVMPALLETGNLSPATAADAPQFEAMAWSLIRNSDTFQDRLYEYLKRAIDVAGALVLMVLTSPLYAVIALAVALTSRGPVLFRHERLGRQGRKFACYKFRTMVADAEQQLRANPRLRAAFEKDYKINGDPRVTRIGKLLRRSSLDELPQLWNVLRGDMSLIGPRPIVEPELGRYGLYSRKLLTVMPGLSGLWQVCGRSDTTYAQRIQFDMLYIDHRSTWLDIKLLLLTMGAVCRKVGAR